MKIVYVAAGAAGMYCGTCLHDNTLAAALIKAGHDVLLAPTYTPLRTDEENVSQPRIFFGGINVYLQQKVSLFRRTPWFVDSWLDSRPLMNWLGRRRATVDASRLGDLTVAMLQGEDGNLKKELEKLVRWLEQDVRPDVVHLSNAMLISMAGEIRRRLNVPIVCSLSGEDVFLELLQEPYYSEARELLKQRSGDADAYVALNRYYAEFMIDYMGLDPRQVRVIPHGLNLEGHAAPGVNNISAANRPEGNHRPFTVGYFARVCPDKGFHHLIEAFKLLCRDGSLPPIQLHAAGYMSDDDKHYLAKHEQHLRDEGLAERFKYLGEPDRAEKIHILQSFDVMSVPTVYRESKGLSVLEAMANGIPVVQPAHGAFPELIEDTGGGLLFEPDNPADLAATLKRLIVDPQQAAELGRRGQQAIHDRYNAERMAGATLDLYAEVCGGNRAARVVDASIE